MSQHLGGVHLPPSGGGIRTESLDSRRQLTVVRRIEEGLHRSEAEESIVPERSNDLPKSGTDEDIESYRLVQAPGSVVRRSVVTWACRTMHFCTGEVDRDFH